MVGLPYRTRSKWHSALQTDAARLDVGRVWLFSPGQFVFPTKGIYRRLQLCYVVDLHFMWRSELRNKALKSSTKKAGLQEEHGRARGSKADVTL